MTPEAQITDSLLMIRPVGFGYNPQTAVNNVFQKLAFANQAAQTTQQKALDEFKNFTRLLRKNGVNVYIFDDTPEPATPDSIFPNNWVSFHANGSVITYPMFAKNRRLERQNNIIEGLRQHFIINHELHLEHLELDQIYVEGTGSLVLDRPNKKAYACLSARTHLQALDIFASKTGYQIISFNATNGQGHEIYHTNVLMCIGESFALICHNTIRDLVQKNKVLDSLRANNKEIIEIKIEQMEQFAGNMLQVKNKKGELLIIMSKSAYFSLNPYQIGALSKHGRLIYSPLSTIEGNGGGSARCMLAEIHLPKK
jgi:hypothetical protein